MLKKLNVGFVWNNPKKEYGGGPLFGRKILQSISSAKNKIRHNLYLLNIGEPDPLVGKWQTYYKKEERKKTGFIKILDSVLNKKRQNNLKNQILLRHEELENHFDLLIFLYPEVFEKTNVMQISTIFDISHKYCPYFPEIGNWEERNRRETLFNKITSNASYIITGTKILQNELEKYYGWNKELVFLVPHPAFDTKQKRKKPKRNTPKKFAIYPAQFWPHKNHVVLVEAWKSFKNSSFHELHLIFTGSDQGNMYFIKKLVKKYNLEEKIHFYGFLPHEDVLDLISAAEVLVYPSLFGPENLPPLEAFACGCPVICSNVPGAKEQLGKAAVLVSPNDPSAWVKSIQSVLSSKKNKNRMIKNGFLRAKSRSLEITVRKIFCLINNIAAIRKKWASGSFPPDRI